MLAKVNLANLSPADFTQTLIDLGAKPCHVKALMQSIAQYGVSDVTQIHGLPKWLKKTLSNAVNIEFPVLLTPFYSTDGVIKSLIKLACGNCIECVYIPEPGRATLCVSSQIGCSLNCDFCATGKEGFNRNLSISEIVGQLWIFLHHIKIDEPITNVVFMGMGEPLLNFDRVIAAVQWMLHDHAYGLSKYRVTVSTSGLVPQMLRFITETEASLALSLHAPDDATRVKLVPLNAHYPIAELIRACEAYVATHPKRKILIEYVMLAGVNDGLEQAQQLAELLKHVPVKINLIPFNTFAGTDYRCARMENMDTFKRVLRQSGLVVTLRKTRGAQKQAACGQLVGQFKNKIRRQREANNERC